MISTDARQHRTRATATRSVAGRGRALRSLLIFALLAATLLAGTMAWNQVATMRAAAAYPPRGQFVDVGGARMHVICQGVGEPTLVLQAGIAGGALDWLPVMEKLATTNRVCAFDRLGQDWSDPAPTPRTFVTAVDEWHRALVTLGIEKPIVVGHSLGGAVVQLYAARYPVQGVVLVDGLTAEAAGEVTGRFATYRSLNGLAHAGLLRPLGKLFADAAYPDELRREMTALRARTQALLNVTAEGTVAAETLPAALSQATGRWDAPLLVVAAGASRLPEAELFLAGQRTLVAGHPKAEFTLIPEAGHYVIASHPEQVADVIQRWLAAR